MYRIEVECSSGTYIRSLAADLGHLLGGGAHLRDLRRTAIGSFTEAEAAPPDVAPLLPPAEALRDYTRVEVDPATAALVAHGRVLPAFAGPAPWAVLGPDGDLLAVYEPHGPDGGTAEALGRAGGERIACPAVQVISDLSVPPWPGSRPSSPSARSTASTSATPPWSPRSAGWPLTPEPGASSSPSTGTRPASCDPSRRPAC